MEKKVVTIQFLLDTKQLSVRAYNVCLANQLFTVSQIAAYFKKNGTFINLRNIGVKTSQELYILCIDEIKKKSRVEEPPSPNELLVAIDTFDSRKLSLFYYTIGYFVNTLSVRSKQGIAKLMKSGDYGELLNNLIANNFNFDSLNNIGAVSKTELIAFKAKISWIISQFEALPNGASSKEYIKLGSLILHKVQPDHFDSTIENLLLPNGKIKLFQTIEHLAKSNNFFDPKERSIFFKTFCNELRDLESYVEAAEYFEIPVVTFLDKLNAVYKKITDFVVWTSFLTIEDFSTYGIEKDTTCFVIDSGFIKNIQESEAINFNQLCCCIILDIRLNLTHTVLYNHKLTLGFPYKRTRDTLLTNGYIILKRLEESFRFKPFLEDIYQRIHAPIRQTYSLQLDNYLLPFFTGSLPTLYQEIIPICKTILAIDFGITTDNNGNAIFEKNKAPFIADYVYEVLENSGKPMKLKDIISEIEAKYPQTNMNEGSLKATLNGNKNVFINFGRSNTFGLKKWETEKAGIKGGSIRKIIAEYLKTEKNPKHILEIFDYVSQYRVTTLKNVQYVLNREANHSFLNFGGDYYGLPEKKYPKKKYEFLSLSGEVFYTKHLLKHDGKDLEDVIGYYVKLYGCASVQVRFALEKKVADGIIEITSDNKLQIIDK